MEHDALGLNFSIFNVHFVSTQNNGDVLTHSDQISVPIGHVFVRDTRGDVEHDDGTLTLNVVPITQSTKFLLAGRVPDVETYRPSVRVEHQRMHFDTKRGDVFLFEFTSQVTFDKCGFASTTVTDKDALESGHFLFLGHFQSLSGNIKQYCEQWVTYNNYFY